MGEGAVLDHVDPGRIDTQVSPEAPLPVLAVDDDGVGPAERAAQPGDLARMGLARHHVGSGSDQRAVG